MTAPLNLEALKQAALEATPGNWLSGWDLTNGLTGERTAPTVYLDETDAEQVPIFVDSNSGSYSEAIAWVLSSNKDGARIKEDATFIAAANPSVILELIRRLEVAERQRDMLAVAAEDAAKELERDGDEWGVASDLREAITSVGRPDNSTSARLVNCPTCFTAFPVSLDVNPLDVVTVEHPKEGGAE